MRSPRLATRLVLVLILFQVLAGIALPWRSAGAAARPHPPGICSTSPAAADASRTQPAEGDDTVHCLFCLPLFQGHLVVPASPPSGQESATTPERLRTAATLRLPLPDPTRRWAPPRAPPITLAPDRT